MPNEGDPLEILVTIHPPTASAALWLGDQPYLFVIANGGDLDSR